MAHENDGHRARLRERMMKEGLSSFQDHEILEMLLFQYLPRRDTNKLAHELLNKFGGIAGVLNATPYNLMMVKGVSEATACNIALLKEVWQRCKRNEAERISLNGLSSIVKYAQLLISESYIERLVVVYVDNATRFLYRDVFDSNSDQFVHVDVKQILETVVRIRAAGVILFHCHSQGVCAPSAEDISFTEDLLFSLANLHVVLLEHLIFNNADDFYSFYRNGDIAAIREKFKRLR